MDVEVINVLHPFLSFVESFSQEKAHNMVALMLDPCFKGMDCIMDYIVGFAIMGTMRTKY
jgi:hypothetical protein